MLHHDTLAKNLHVVHFEKARVDLVPVWHTHGDGVKLWGVIMEWPTFELVNAGDGEVV